MKNKETFTFALDKSGELSDEEIEHFRSEITDLGERGIVELSGWHNLSDKQRKKIRKIQNKIGNKIHNREILLKVLRDKGWIFLNFGRKRREDD